MEAASPDGNRGYSGQRVGMPLNDKMSCCLKKNSTFQPFGVRYTLYKKTNVCNELRLPYSIYAAFCGGF